MNKNDRAEGNSINNFAKIIYIEENMMNFEVFLDKINEEEEGKEQVYQVTLDWSQNATIITK